jgi:hypothetical protein
MDDNNDKNNNIKNDDDNDKNDSSQNPNPYPAAVTSSKLSASRPVIL